MTTFPISDKVYSGFLLEPTIRIYILYLALPRLIRTVCLISAIEDLGAFLLLVFSDFLSVVVTGHDF